MPEALAAPDAHPAVHPDVPPGAHPDACPDAAAPGAAPPGAEGAAAAWWRARGEQLHALLADLAPPRPAPDALQRLAQLHRQIGDRLHQQPDAALYHLIHDAGCDSRRYCARHALLCAVVAELCAQTLQWPAPLRDSLGRAALTMNLAMHGLQDALARQGRLLEPGLRAWVAGHAERSAEQLQAAGVRDGDWLRIVRQHHDPPLRGLPLSALAPAEAAARLLRRVDVFTARLSCRGPRQPLSPVRAARDAALGADGMPDEIGTALLLTLGLYPPGSAVRLVSGERGLVYARGPRPNLPWVAVLRDAEGRALAQPERRPCHDRRYAVRSAAPPAPPEPPLDAPPHERLVALA